MDPPEVNYRCCRPSLVFHQEANTPLGLKLIFISLVSSTFLHICSKSYYEAFVIWITLANWKVSPGKSWTRRQSLQSNHLEHGKQFVVYRKTRAGWEQRNKEKCMKIHMCTFKHFRWRTCWAWVKVCVFWRVRVSRIQIHSARGEPPQTRQSLWSRPSTPVVRHLRGNGNRWSDGRRKGASGMKGNKWRERGRKTVWGGSYWKGK